MLSRVAGRWRGTDGRQTLRTQRIAKKRWAAATPITGPGSFAFRKVRSWQAKNAFKRLFRRLLAVGQCLCVCVPRNQQLRNVAAWSWVERFVAETREYNSGS